MLRKADAADGEPRLAPNPIVPFGSIDLLIELVRIAPAYEVLRAAAVADIAEVNIRDRCFRRQAAHVDAVLVVLALVTENLDTAQAQSEAATNGGRRNFPAILVMRAAGFASWLDSPA
ncbi:hypothetical protein AB6806_19940 [Bosea sp. RCC_152_1]|uniref:hypothetical protein n=1 Tax=Bosea sp. RCC_152_1 TaxID=3239228 RepID=UPI003523E787